jgi:hypothetical protein
MDGDFFYDAVAQSFVHFHNGFWTNLESVGTVAAITDLTAAQMTPAIVRNSVVRITGVGVFPHLCGLAASYSAKTISIYNASDHWISVEYNSSVEPTANNRILTPTLGSMNIVVGEIATFTYDIIQNRWLLVSISSQSGAQVPATITSNGLVSLHQASATPWEPIVFTDGDYNTPTGFVGLDANRAAFIAPTLGNTVALTLTGLGTGAALVATGGSGAGAAGASITSLTYRGVSIQGGGSSPGVFSIGGATDGSGGIFTGGGTGGKGLETTGGSTGGAGMLATGTGIYAAIAAYGAGAPQAGITELQSLYGVAAILAQAGSAGGNGIVTAGVGTGYAGIRTVGGSNGHGIIADAGSGTGKAGIFNGAVNMSSTLDVTGLTTIGSLAVTGVGGIATATGFEVAATTANVSTSGTMGSAGMLSVDTGNIFNGTWTTTSASLHLGQASGEGIGSKRTAGGNLNGLDFYTNNLSRMSISNGGIVTIPGNFVVNGTSTLNAIASNTTLSAVSDIIVDSSGIFDGGLSAGTEQTVRFGATNSGEAIGSKRTATGNTFGLDFYTQGISRLIIANGGAVTIPGATTINGVTTINAATTINSNLFVGSLNSTGATLFLNGATSVSSTLAAGGQISAPQLNISGSAFFGTGGGANVQSVFDNGGNVAGLSIGGARDPDNYGAEGSMWWGSGNNISAGQSGSAWYLNILIGGLLYQIPATRIFTTD